jgi:hypothetical protein
MTCIQCTLGLASSTCDQCLSFCVQEHHGIDKASVVYQVSILVSMSTPVIVHGLDSHSKGELEAVQVNWRGPHLVCRL